MRYRIVAVLAFIGFLGTFGADRAEAQSVEHVLTAVAPQVTRVTLDPTRLDAAGAPLVRVETNDPALRMGQMTATSFEASGAPLVSVTGLDHEGGGAQAMRARVAVGAEPILFTVTTP